jgi:subfamily B ATP-binding cassette protein MsbA
MNLKSKLKENFRGFFFFFGILRYRVFFALVVSIFIGLMDALGLTMFLPLLQLVSGEGEIKPESLGNLQIVIKGITNLGFTLNLGTTLFFLSVFFFLKGILTFYGHKYQVIIRQLFLRKLRISLLNNLNGIRFEEYIKWDQGRIQNGFTTETERITGAFTNYFRAMNFVVNVIVYGVFAIYTDPAFALLVILVASFAQFFYAYLYKLNRRASRNLSSGNSSFHGMVSQYIMNFKYLRATGRQAEYGERMIDVIKSIEEENRKMGYYNAILASTREPLLLVIISIVIFIQSEIFKAPLGPIIISLMFFYRALTSLTALQTVWNLYMRYSGSVENISDLSIQLKNSRQKRTGSSVFMGFKEYIELKNVSFSYSDKPVIRNINLRIEKNQTVALVGGSGSGKTTLANLISGLFLSYEGNYEIDGKGIKEYDINTFRNKIGYISQDPVIFNCSIYDNITFWAEKTPENINRFSNVIKKTSLDEFIIGLEFKEDTILGASGFNLSGGQKQRISIARELFRNVEMLILDEATSALDSETEKAVQASLVNLKGSLTIIMIAHRLSTVKHVDTIALMHEGKIVNSGSFESLLIDDGQFQSMVKLQTF